MQSRASFFSSCSFIQTFFNPNFLLFRISLIQNFFYPDFYEQIKPSLFSHNVLISARAV